MTRCLLACGRIDKIHIMAVNVEIGRRIRAGEAREIDEWEDRPVNYEAMRARKLPKVELSPETDWWGGAVLPGTQHPATLAHVAMKAYAEHYKTGQWYICKLRRGMLHCGTSSDGFAACLLGRGLE